MNYLYLNSSNPLPILCAASCNPTLLVSNERLGQAHFKPTGVSLNVGLGNPPEALGGQPRSKFLWLKCFLLPSLSIPDGVRPPGSSRGLKVIEAAEVNFFGLNGSVLFDLSVDP